jgi:Reverse transcriptase (RNA-dependent DNA polymerase)
MNGTFTLSSLSPGHVAIPSMYLFEIKRDDKGRIVKYKCCCVGKGYRQVERRDYDNVFAPVSKQATFRMLLSIVTSENLSLHQMDIETAFLNGDLTEELYVCPTEGDSMSAGKVLRLHKALYGLKQAARDWYLKLTSTLKKLGFQAADCDVALLHQASCFRDI